jgi:hypothetical protein
LEGLFTGRVLAATRDLSITDLKDGRHGLRCLDPAALGTSAESQNRDHHVLAGIISSTGSTL